MSDAYRQLLDATILHLEQLSAHGASYVAVSMETFAAIQATANRSGLNIGFGPAAAPQAARSAAARPTVPRTIVPILGPSPLPSNSGAEPPTPAERGLGLALPGAGSAPACPALSPEAKTAAFADLRVRALACQKCPHLVSSRKTVVFGVGNIDAQLMFIGEAPGADEDEQGEPFVGKAGQLLTKIINTMGLQRSDVYIGNILKCRPDTPGQVAGNRKPTSDEMATCIPFLHEQIDLIRPRVIVALGATAVEGLLGKTVGITRLRGTWQTYRGIPLMPTYHPAFLLRNQAMTEKRKVWEDMLRVMERLGMLISDKQRGFFLRA